MSLPQLLLVDDSEAILAYESAALSAHYAVSTAKNGREALRLVRELKPDAMLLDLSMPEVSGDQVLAQMTADPDLRAIPVIVITTERHREKEVLAAGAAAFLPKPIKAADLMALVGEVLERRRQRERLGGLAVLPAEVGPHRLAFPVDRIYAVVDMPATMSLPLGPDWLSAMFVLHGRPVCVLDMAVRLGVSHRVDLVDRKLVVVSQANQLIALVVDHVDDPDEIPPERVTDRTQLGGSDHPPLNELLRAMIRQTDGSIPVVEPGALLSPRLLEELADTLKGIESRAGAAAT